MDLARCVENALENIEKTFRIDELERVVESSNKIHNNLMFIQRQVEEQMRVKERIIMERLRVCRCLSVMGERITEGALEHMTRLGESDVCGDREKRRRRVSVLLRILGNNIEIETRMVDIYRANNERLRETYRRMCSRKLRLMEILIEGEEVRAGLRGGLRHGTGGVSATDCRERAMERVALVLSQGSLENDIRFVELIERTLLDAERFDAPEIARMSVQFVIAKKYVEDMISLKSDGAIRKYLEDGEG